MIILSTSRACIGGRTCAEVCLRDTSKRLKKKASLLLMIHKLQYVVSFYLCIYICRKSLCVLCDAPLSQSIKTALYVVKFGKFPNFQTSQTCREQSLKSLETFGNFSNFPTFPNLPNLENFSNF